MEPSATDKVYARAKELFAQKNFNGALAALDEILDQNSQDTAALELAGDVFAASGDIPQAMGHYGLGIQAAPDANECKRKFINIAGKMIFTQYNPAVAEILCLCLATPEIDCAHAQLLWYTLLRSHPQFLKLLENKFEKPADLSFLLEPIFMLGVKRIVVCNKEFEEFMTALRRFLLETNAPNHALIEAAAQYCFNTDYIFNRTGTEEKIIANLRRELESNPAARHDVVKTGLYACYEPFYKLKIANDMSYLPAVKARLDYYTDLQKRAAQIPSLTEIVDPVSLKVREQYEEFPYPRWRELPLPKSTQGPALNMPGMQILVAGCGTGQEPLILGKACPQATILAIDLSRESLAYASRKAEELGIKNVTFQHADILQLGSLAQKFDCICSGGVLHHMKDPVAGWKVLTGLLKPGGFMRIGLYSAIARRSISAAREIIREKNYPSTAEGMRRFRKDSDKLLGDDLNNEIWDAMDYYHLNMYRDLLFHVQEHQFTLPQLQKTLDDLGLTFLEFFDLPPQQQSKGKTLADWNKIEEANPALFSRMYNFWCWKK